MKTSASGMYYDGQTAKAHPVRISWSGNGLQVSADPSKAESQGKPTSTLFWDQQNIQVEYLSNEHIHIFPRKSSEEFVKVHDTEFVTYLRKYSSLSGWGTMFSSSKMIATICGILLSLIVALAIAVWSSIAPLSKSLAHKVPFHWEEKIQTLYIKDLEKKQCENEEAHKVLYSLEEKLLTGHQWKGRLKIIILKDKVVNAFALPGGVVVINTGFLAQVKNGEEIAGVLAHEFQHQIQRHILASLIRATFLTTAWTILVGDFSGVMVIDPATLMNLVQLKFSRDAESEADLKAVELLDQAQISRMGMINFFDRLSKKTKGIPEFISSHPLDDRGEKLKKGMPEHSFPALTANQLNILKEACKGDYPSLIEELKKDLEKSKKSK